MTSTNDGKEVKINQTSGQKGKSFYVELYKSLDGRLSGECELSDRTQHLCEAWRRVHSLCQHSAPTTHPHLVAWLQRHTARTILQTEWQSPKSKDEHKNLEEAIDEFIEECDSATEGRNGVSPPWESQLRLRGEWFKKILANPWGHPVLRVLLDPRGQPPSDDEILGWLKEERGVMFVTRLRQLATSKCDDLAMSLVTCVMDRVRDTTELLPDSEQAAHREQPTMTEGTFALVLRVEAGFTVEVWELVTDIEFVLLHKADKMSKCIELAKQTPLRDGYQLVERLQSRLENSPREKKLWKNAKEVATLIAQVIIARCMVVPICAGVARTALYCCARSLARLIPKVRLPAAAATLAAPAATARHLHTLAAAYDAQCSSDMKPFVCELYVRAITAGMNELERLKLKTERESEARSAEQTLCSWFTQLGSLLSASDRIKCECTLTAFSVHPSPAMYDRIKNAPILPPVTVDDQDIKQETTSEFGSWATDSRTYSNLVKTSETLNIKQTQPKANVLSTAILTEGEGLGLSPELCMDLAVLLSGPRMKTLYWDMDRELLLDNCRTYLERTHGGTRALTTELKYLNLDPRSYQHLPEEEDDENDVFYGIEKGYEHLVELQEQDRLSPNAIFDFEDTESAYSDIDIDSPTPVRRKKKTKKPKITSDEESDPLSIVAEAKKNEKKKERPLSKERSKDNSSNKEKKEKKKKKKATGDSAENKERSRERRKDGSVSKEKKEGKEKREVKKKKDGKQKKESMEKKEGKEKEGKEKKPRKKKLKEPKVEQLCEHKPGSLSSLIGMKVTKITSPDGKHINPEAKATGSVTDSDYDSQGKSSLASLNSEGNGPDVLFDGLFTDEFRSPENSDPLSERRGSFPNSEVSFARGQVAINYQKSNKLNTQSLLKQPHYKIKPEQTVSDASSPSSPQSLTTADVKKKISGLLEFRRQNMLERAHMLENAQRLAALHNFKTPPLTPPLLSPLTPPKLNPLTPPNLNPSTPFKSPNAIIQPIYPEQQIISPKAVEVPEIPKVYINKNQIDQIKAIRDEVDVYLKSKFSSKPVIQYASKQTTDESQQSTTQNECLNLSTQKHDSCPTAISQQQTQHSVTVQSINRPNLSFHESYEKSLQDFLRELHETSNAGTGKCAKKTAKSTNRNVRVKKEVKPVSRVTPITPNVSSKVEPTSSHCAKINNQGKQLETQLNTFARLSYMHKNKQLAEAVLNHQEYMLNRSIEEQRLAQFMCLQNSNVIKSKTCKPTQKTAKVDDKNIVIRKVEKPTVSQEHPRKVEKPTISQDRPHKIEKPIVSEEHLRTVEKPTVLQDHLRNVEKPTVSQEHPLLSDLLYEKPYARSDSIVKNILLQPEKRRTGSSSLHSKESSLSQKDQNDLLSLLRQQNMLNTHPAPYANTVFSKNNKIVNDPQCSKTTTANSSNCNPTVNITETVIKNHPIETSNHTYNINQNYDVLNIKRVLEATQNVTFRKVIDSKTAELSKTITSKKGDAESCSLNPFHNQVETKHNENQCNSYSTKVDANGKDWQDVMNALLSHKTPSRGPNALDMVLKKGSDKKLRNQRIVRPNVINETSKEPKLCNETNIKQVNTVPHVPNAHSHPQIVKSSIPSTVPLNSTTMNLGRLQQPPKLIDSIPKKQADIVQSEIDKLMKRCNQPETTKKLIKESRPRNSSPSVPSCKQTSKNVKKRTVPQDIARPSCMQEEIKSKDIIKKLPNIEKPKRAPTLKKPCTTDFVQEKDPFISGISNSDYDLLEELMDDELRKEIGELSSDEDTYRVQTSNVKSTKTPSTSICSNVIRNAPPQQEKTHITYATNEPQSCRKSIIQTNQIHAPCQNKPKVISDIKIVNNNLAPNQFAGKIIKQYSKNCKTSSDFAASNQIACPTVVHQPLNTNVVSIEQPSPLTSGNHVSVVDPRNVIITMPQRTLQNVVVIGSELVYDPYAATQTTGLTNVNQSSYVTFESPPNLTVFQTTQFAAPLVNPCIIGNAMMQPTSVSMLEVPLDNSTTQQNRNCSSLKSNEVPESRGEMAKFDKTNLNIQSETVIQTNNVSHNFNNQGLINSQECELGTKPKDEVLKPFNMDSSVAKKDKDVTDAMTHDEKADILMKPTEIKSMIVSPSNKNCKRKVLKEVHEKQKLNDEIQPCIQKQITSDDNKKTDKELEQTVHVPKTFKEPKHSVENVLTKESTKEKERLKNKRLALLNREMNHRSDDPPIPLNYTPLKLNSSPSVKKVVTTAPSKETRRRSRVESDNIKNNNSNNNMSTNNEKHVNDNSKENDSIPTPRRILLRSSNVIQAKDSDSHTTKIIKKKAKVVVKDKRRPSGEVSLLKPQVEAKGKQSDNQCKSSKNSKKLPKLILKVPAAAPDKESIKPPKKVDKLILKIPKPKNKKTKTTVLATKKSIKKKSPKPQLNKSTNETNCPTTTPAIVTNLNFIDVEEALVGAKIPRKPTLLEDVKKTKCSVAPENRDKIFIQHLDINSSEPLNNNNSVSNIRNERRKKTTLDKNEEKIPNMKEKTKCDRAVEPLASKLNILMQDNPTKSVSNNKPLDNNSDSNIRNESLKEVTLEKNKEIIPNLKEKTKCDKTVEPLASKPNILMQDSPTKSMSQNKPLDNNSDSNIRNESLKEVTLDKNKEIIPNLKEKIKCDRTVEPLASKPNILMQDSHTKSVSSNKSLDNNSDSNIRNESLKEVTLDESKEKIPNLKEKKTCDRTVEPLASKPNIFMQDDHTKSVSNNNLDSSSKTSVIERHSKSDESTPTASLKFNAQKTDQDNTVIQKPDLAKAKFIEGENSCTVIHQQEKKSENSTSVIKKSILEININENSDTSQNKLYSSPAIGNNVINCTKMKLSNSSPPHKNVPRKEKISQSTNVVDNLKKDDTLDYFKNNVTIEEMPEEIEDGNSDKKCVRIKLPNGKIFKATVYGKMHFSYESLFSNPTLKNALLSNLNPSRRRYTLNVKQVSTQLAQDPSKIVGARIEEIKLQPRGDVIETVNLLSDDEEENDVVTIQDTKIEFGGFKVSDSNKQIFEQHRDKLSKKCLVKLVRTETKKEEAVKECENIPIVDLSDEEQITPLNEKVLIDINSVLTEKVTKIAETKKAEAVKHCENIPIVDISDEEKITPLNEKVLVDINSVLAEKVTKFEAEKVIEIDDSSNDSLSLVTDLLILPNNHTKEPNDFNISPGENYVKPEAIINELKNLLLKDLGVGESENQETVHYLGNEILRGVSSDNKNCKDAPIIKECTVTLTRCDSLVEQYEKAMIIKQKSLVNVVCDDTIKARNDVKSHDEKLLASDEFIDAGIDEDNQNETCLLSRSNSLSLLDDFMFYNQEDTVKEESPNDSYECDRSSPVIDVFETIVTFRNYSKVEKKRHDIFINEINPLFCSSEWSKTKRETSLDSKLAKLTLIKCDNVCLDTCIMSHSHVTLKTEIPSLKSLTAKLFKNYSILDSYTSSGLRKTSYDNTTKDALHSFTHTLKRKLNVCLDTCIMSHSHVTLKTEIPSLKTLTAKLFKNYSILDSYTSSGLRKTSYDNTTKDALQSFTHTLKRKLKSSEARSSVSKFLKMDNSFILDVQEKSNHKNDWNNGKLNTDSTNRNDGDKNEDSVVNLPVLECDQDIFAYTLTENDSIQNVDLLMENKEINEIPGYSRSKVDDTRQLHSLPNDQLRSELTEVVGKTCNESEYSESKIVFKSIAPIITAEREPVIRLSGESSLNQTEAAQVIANTSDELAMFDKSLDDIIGSVSNEGVPSKSSKRKFKKSEDEDSRQNKDNEYIYTIDPVSNVEDFSTFNSLTDCVTHSSDSDLIRQDVFVKSESFENIISSVSNEGETSEPPKCKFKKSEEDSRQNKDSEYICTKDPVNNIEDLSILNSLTDCVTYSSDSEIIRHDVFVKAESFDNIISSVPNEGEPSEPTTQSLEKSEQEDSLQNKNNENVYTKDSVIENQLPIQNKHNIEDISALNSLTDCITLFSDSEIIRQDVFVKAESFDNIISSVPNEGERSEPPTQSLVKSEQEDSRQNKDNENVYTIDSVNKDELPVQNKHNIEDISTFNSLTDCVTHSSDSEIIRHDVFNKAESFDNSVSSVSNEGNSSEPPKHGFEKSEEVDSPQNRDNENASTKYPVNEDPQPIQSKYNIEECSTLNSPTYCVTHSSDSEIIRQDVFVKAESFDNIISSVPNEGERSEPPTQSLEKSEQEDSRQNKDNENVNTIDSVNKDKLPVQNKHNIEDISTLNSLTDCVTHSSDSEIIKQDVFHKAESIDNCVCSVLNESEPLGSPKHSCQKSEDSPQNRDNDNAYTKHQVNEEPIQSKHNIEDISTLNSLTDCVTHSSDSEIIKQDVFHKAESIDNCVCSVLNESEPLGSPKHSCQKSEDSPQNRDNDNAYTKHQVNEEPIQSKHNIEDFNALNSHTDCVTYSSDTEIIRQGVFDKAESFDNNISSVPNEGEPLEPPKHDYEKSEQEDSQQNKNNVNICTTDSVNKLPLQTKYNIEDFSTLNSVTERINFDNEIIRQDTKIEFGGFKISDSNKQVFEKHRNKLTKKCLVKLVRTKTKKEEAVKQCKNIPIVDLSDEEKIKQDVFDKAESFGNSVSAVPMPNEGEPSKSTTHSFEKSEHENSRQNKDNENIYTIDSVNEDQLPIQNKHNIVDLSTLYSDTEVTHSNSGIIRQNNADVSSASNDPMSNKYTDIEINNEFGNNSKETIENCSTAKLLNLDSFQNLLEAGECDLNNIKNSQSNDSLDKTNKKSEHNITSKEDHCDDKPVRVQGSGSELKMVNREIDKIAESQADCDSEEQKMVVENKCSDTPCDIETNKDESYHVSFTTKNGDTEKIYIDCDNNDTDLDNTEVSSEPIIDIQKRCKDICGDITNETDAGVACKDLDVANIVTVESSKNRKDCLEKNGVDCDVNSSELDINRIENSVVDEIQSEFDLIGQQLVVTDDKCTVFNMTNEDDDNLTLGKEFILVNNDVNNSENVVEVEVNQSELDEVVELHTESHCEDKISLVAVNDENDKRGDDSNSTNESTKSSPTVELLDHGYASPNKTVKMNLSNAVGNLQSNLSVEVISEELIDYETSIEDTYIDTLKEKFGNPARKEVTLVCKDRDDLVLTGIEYEDPVEGTCYVFPIVEENDETEEVIEVTQEIDDSEHNVTKLDERYLSEEDILEVKIPKVTYSRLKTKTALKNIKLKRKIDMTDVIHVGKRYRKENQLRSRITPANLVFGKEYKRVIDYCTSLKFSFSHPFHKDAIDVQDLLKNWPIKGACAYSDSLCDNDASITLFRDEDSIRSNPADVPFAEEINENYNDLESQSNTVDESNFKMGFGEGSDRVIQNLEEVGDVSKFSAATLSDVKQPQPFLLSEEYYCKQELCSQEKKFDDQLKKLKQYITYIQLRDKVRSFFQKTSVELSMGFSTLEKVNNFNYKSSTKHKMNCPFDLCLPDFIEPSPIEAVVQVVQVGQLPVSAAAQNPVTCDPRVTQVSDASPSQCSVENSPHDDAQVSIKTEYTELTTADLTLPLVQEYAQHNHNFPVESQSASNIQMSNENIPIETEVKSVVKIELEELPEVKEENRENFENNEFQSSENKNDNNVDFSFESSNSANSGNLEPQSDFQNIFNAAEKQIDNEAYTQKQQNGTSEKTDQIAHAMNAAGITTSQETMASATRAHALVNILSQKLRQGAIGAAQSATNTYPKTTSINAMALQQALAQILPPPLNQTNVNDSNQQSSNTQVAPQVLHIVQGKNATGSQITLVDNSQQSVINSANATPVLHIVQNKSGTTSTSANGTATSQANSFSGLSLVDAGLQQGGNQLLHIVNTGSQKNNNATGQLLKRVNLLTNLANVQGSNEQKMVQFVCKSADGKSIQLNAPHQRSMVLRLQPIETPNVTVQATPPKSSENQDGSTNSNTNSLAGKDNSSQQEIKSRSVYEENYAKFIQNSSKSTISEKSTSLPKFNQAFGKPVFQDGNQKSEINSNNSHLSSVNNNNDTNECQSNDNAMNLDHIGQISSPPLLLRKSPQTSQSQANLVQQLKQTIAPMNIQTMHGGVIYTRQIPVNIGGGQTINLITVPSTELIDDSAQKQQSGNQTEIEQSIIKIVPQSQNTSNSDMTAEESNVPNSGSNENTHNSQPQPVLTQMRIKLPMLSKAPQMVSGARVVRPSLFQIQRNVIGGANQPVYQQLVLTAAPSLGQQTIRLPQTQTSRPIKVPTESQSSAESHMSSSTLEQLREFDMVLEQVKERSTVQPGSSTSTTFPKLHTPSTDTTDSGTSASSTSTEGTQQVLYSIGNSQPLNVAYVNRKATVTTPTTTGFARSPDSSGIVDSPTSTHVQIPHTVTSETTQNENSSQQKAAKVSSKSKSRPKASSNPPNNLKLNTVPPKTSAQKPLEDEQTTQRILYILAEYKEQVENSPDKDKPAPRRRSNPPSNPGSSKRKKSSSGSRRHGARDLSPVHGEDTCRTMGSEDSSCGTSQGDCNESCLESHSPQDSPRKVVRKLTFEPETPTPQPRPQPQRNVIVADGQTITVARGTAGKPATAVLMPANYILPVSMVKGGQQIAIVTNRGPKLLTVGGGEGGATNALLLQRLIGPAGLKPVLARPGVRHVRLPTAALHNLQAFNLATTTTIQPPDSTASPAPAPTPPELVDTRATSSPWTDRDMQDVKPERASSPEGSEPWNLPSSGDPHDYSYEETVRAENLDRTVLDPIPDRYSPDMEAQRIFDKMFDVESKKSYMGDSHDDSPRCGYDIDASDCDDKAYHQVVQKKDGSSHRQHRLTHVSAAALRHKYAILEHELRLQKSLSEECEDLGVDSPSASELFPEAELLFAASPAHDHTQDHAHHSHTPQPTHLNQSGIPQPDMDDQIATDQLLSRNDMHDDQRDLNLGLEDVGIVTVSEDGMQATIALDQEEFARSHPNTTFHSEPTDDGEVQPFTIAGLKARHITSTIFHSNRAPATVLMTTPQTTVISQATTDNNVKYGIDNMMNSLPSGNNSNINLASVLVKDDGLTRFDNILNDSRELHLSNTASAIVHPTGNATQVIRRVCYDDDKRDNRFLMDEPDALIAGDDAKMIAEDSSRDATLESMADVDDDRSSPERHAELFWESNSASASESRRPLDFSSDSEKCCKSPSYDTNSTDSSGVGTHMRLDSVIKEARGIERSASAEGSSADDTHPPLRTYPPKRTYHPLEGEVERSLSGKTRAGERSPDSLEVRRRASGRGVVKRGCHCCNGSPAPPRPKKPRQRKPTMDFTN